MLFFLVSVLPLFILLSKTLPLPPPPSWAGEVRLLSNLFWQEFLYVVVHSLKNFKVADWCILRTMFAMASRRKRAHRVANVEEIDGNSILDLPDLALECILGKLSPESLCNMACVCSSLRERCRSDYVWERHMREKWGRVTGPSARREWELYLALRKDTGGGRIDGTRSKRLIGSLSCIWPLSWLISRNDIKPRIPLIDNSLLSWYLSLESGKLWFRAQVYNREHGHVGFMLSCYDAELSYNCHTDTFQARYPPHGRRTVVVEDGVQWERIRTPPVDTPASDLHISNCLHDLRPGDHIEIQWRRNKEFPYGWWYGVVGHLESCDGRKHFCRCHLSDTIVLEFNQYTPGSRWRRATVSRKDHREEGNEADGFYGGIRKLYARHQISTWKRLWPVEVLE